MSIADLRKLAGRGRGPTADDTTILDLVQEFAEYKDAFEVHRDQHESVDLAGLDATIASYETLAEMGVISIGTPLELRDAYALLEGNLDTVDTDAMASFIDAYEQVESDWDSYVQVKEEDRYPGKADDVQAQWDELVAAVETFCDAADALGIDLG